jgi:phenylpyruvate tautomerase PptA (4-oxalocrotonate tautomerase family)
MMTPDPSADGPPVLRNYVRVQVLTNAGALDRAKQIAAVSQFTSMIADPAHHPALADRTWVLLTEAVPGGWGLGGAREYERRTCRSGPRADR